MSRLGEILAESSSWAEREFVQPAIVSRTAGILVYVYIVSAAVDEEGKPDSEYEYGPYPWIGAAPEVDSPAFVVFASDQTAIVLVYTQEQFDALPVGK